MNAPFRPLPPALASAAERVKAAVRAACERTIESLGLAALSSNNVFQRDGLLGAQFELNRKSAIFALTFNGAFDDRLLREVRPFATPDAAPTSWNELSLVDDHEVDVQVAAERFGMQISQHCDWELRDLDTCVGPMLGSTGAPRGETPPRNPLRPEIIGYATIRAIESVSDRADVRKVLEAEFIRSLTATLPQIYSSVMGELRSVGIKPVGMSERLADRAGDRANDRANDRSHDRSAAQNPRGADSGQAPLGGPAQGLSSRGGGLGDSKSMPSGGQSPRRSGGTPLGQVDVELMSLMRRLTVDSRGGNGRGGGEPNAEGHSRSGGPSNLGDFDSGETPFDGYTEDGLRLAAPNLIRAHRDELRGASSGALDHMVIDVVGSLFDQILSDPKVPPQMARQIGRLQLPVLRTALGDPTFFSSRKHPVRRFINRISSLASAFEDLEAEEGKLFLQLVRQLVQGIVEGDFDQAEVYERQLAALEAFVNEQARQEVSEQGDAASLIAQKEGEARVRQHYANRLEGELGSLAVPPFVRDFISQVWSQVLVKAHLTDGTDDSRFKRFRHAGRELFMSVQPKGTPAQRKTFLMQLPKLMQELTEGMDFIAWPAESKKTFFGALLPAHAQSLKGEALSTLDFNLLARQVDKVFDTPIPSQAEVSHSSDPATTSEEAILPTLTAEEIQRIGLVDEASVDWSGKVDIEIGAEPALAEVDIAIDGMPAPEPIEPMQGKSLAAHVQIGYAYQMHLEGAWHKVRLTHVNPARTFYVFSRGRKHKQAISLTHRMLVRLCESERLRAFESAYLVERATARARRQLAKVTPGAAALTA